MAWWVPNKQFREIQSDMITTHLTGVEKSYRFFSTVGFALGVK
jgi:hypothetical protein